MLKELRQNEPSKLYELHEVVSYRRPEVETNRGEVERASPRWGGGELKQQFWSRISQID